MRKRILFSCFMVFLQAVSAFAATVLPPTTLSLATDYKDTWLVSNNYPMGTVQPTSFLVQVDNAAWVVSQPFSNADGSVKLKFDLKNVAVGNHTITVKARNGTTASAASAPVKFHKAIIFTLIKNGAVSKEVINWK